MSGSNYYQPPPGPPPGQRQQQHQQYQDNNPFHQSNQYAALSSYQSQQTYEQNPAYQQQLSSQQYPQQTQAPGSAAFDGNFSAPPPQRAGTFKEADFVPESERGEQREAMEQFELTKHGGETQEDKDLATLQSEFPGLDSSLVAALYGDSKNLGATREMLRELASSQQ